MGHPLRPELIHRLHRRELLDPSVTEPLADDPRGVGLAQLYAGESCSDRVIECVKRPHTCVIVCGAEVNHQYRPPLSLTEGVKERTLHKDLLLTPNNYIRE